MMRIIAALLVIICLAVPALADVDLTAMTDAELTQLRDAVSAELRARQLAADLEALRAGQASAPASFTAGPLTVSLVKVEIGTGRDDCRAVGVILSADNAGEKTLTLSSDFSIELRQGGAACPSTWVHSASFDSSSVSDSIFTKLYPGAHGILIYSGGKLQGESDLLDIEIYLNAARVREYGLDDPFVGRFSVDLSALP